MSQESLVQTSAAPDAGAMPFSLDDPVEIKFSWRGKKYVLRELGEDGHLTYSHFRLASFKYEGGKITNVVTQESVNRQAETPALLVSLCLFYGDGDEPGAPVPLEEIKKWPHRHVEKLSDKAEEISGLKAERQSAEVVTKKIEELQGVLNSLQEGNAPLKNSPGATTASSG